MPTIKEHIEVIKTEINATGKRLETETLTADELIAIGNRMAVLASTANWLNAVEQMNSPIKQRPLIKSIN